MKSGFPSAAGAAVFLFTQADAAFSSPDCEPFGLTTGDVRVVEYVDNGTSGISAGDMRIGNRNLVDGDGTEVGSIRWVATIMVRARADDPTDMFVEYVLDLDEGHINFHHLLQNSRPAEDTSQPSFMSAEPGVIAGGTRRYAGAKGNVFITRDGDAVRYQVEIDCDE